MKRIAVCPGSFDPITNGHLDIIRRTSKIFDSVIVLVVYNIRKPSGVFSIGERVDFIRRSTEDIPNVAVDFYDGLLADYATMNNVTAIVKGLRAVTDYENEFQQALTNKQIAPEIDTLLMVTNAEYMFLSSSAVKEICAYGGDISSFVPPQIHDDIVKKFADIKGNQETFRIL